MPGVSISHILVAPFAVAQFAHGLPPNDSFSRCDFPYSAESQVGRSWRLIEKELVCEFTRTIPAPTACSNRNDRLARLLD
jgi:hypothetical protein